MAEIARELLYINLEDEMRQSYLDYAMSVIVGRALPDARDGLKPVHRRVLFAMHELGNDWNKAYKKSARIVGDVIGKYHPHGDSAVYDTMVRMAQPFSLRYLLIDGQGNFGSVDGDAAAAMRYTEVRLTRVAHEMLGDIDKETVDFVPNYDESEHEPSVLPTRVPNLLVNGSAGIAVGMATNIPPHNLCEIIDACIMVIDQPEVTLAQLMEIVKGPDFPTGGIINGIADLGNAYRNGRGRVRVRARTHFEDISSGRQAIIVTELPYQVNKARLLERIAELHKEKLVEGISEIRDESDKDGMRVVVELKRDVAAEVVLNNLFKQTPLETVFGINMVALLDGQPRLMGLRELLEAFLRHRREVVTRRTVFELRKARDRAHLLEGQAVALANIDEVIAVIKASPSPAEAKVALMERVWMSGAVPEMLARAGAVSTRPEGLSEDFGLLAEGYRLSDAQAQAILELRLNRLTGLERDKIVAEYAALLETIADLVDILSRPERLLQVIRDELLVVREQFGDERRTEINADYLDLEDLDLIKDEPVVVTLSRSGWTKAVGLEEYRVLGRGAQGNDAGGNKEDDTVAKLFVAQTHDTLLCFSDRGKVYALRVYRLPRTSRASRGRPINNLLPLETGENITALLPVRDFEVEGMCVFMATAQGTVKKTALSAFGNVRSSGIRAVTLDEGDRLVGVDVTAGGNEVMLLSSGGKAIRFHEEDVRAMGRDASGVRGITLGDGQEVISLIIVREGMVLTLSENGYGKRTAIEEFPTKGRGGQGVIALQLSERNGKMVAAVQVSDRDQLVIISRDGRLLRTRVGTISVVGRNTQGVKVMRLKDEDTVLEVARVAYVEGMEQEAITTEPDLLPEPGTDLPPPEAASPEADGAEAD